MKTLKELREVAKKKGLKFEVNIWDPTLTKWDLEEGKQPSDDFLKVEIGINYKGWIWAWWEGGIFTREEIEKGEMKLFFRNTYNQKQGAEDKTMQRGWSVEGQLFKGEE